MDETNLDKLLSEVQMMERGCSCGYDYRCGNCDRILRVKELATRILNERDTNGGEAVRPD